MDPERAFLFSAVAAVAVYLIAWVADAVLRSSWIPWYYLGGLEIYRYEVAVDFFGAPSVPREMLDERFRSQFAASIVFRRLSDNDWAFRDDLAVWKPIRFNGLMHGRLRLDQERKRVVVHGYTDWATIWLCIAACALGLISMSIAALVLVVALVIILGINYAIQSSRYEEVGQFAAYRLSVPMADQQTRA